jgi:hypothetical protein
VNEVATPASGSLLDDLLEIFVAPSKVFERRRNSGYGMLMLILVVLTVLISVATMSLTAPYWDAQFDLSMKLAAAKGQEMPAEATGPMARTAGRWFGVLGGAIFVPIFVWLGGLFVLMGSKIAGANVSYKQGALIFTLAGFPRLLAPIIMSVQSLMVTPESIRSFSDGALGPARFFDPLTTSPILLGVLGNFELTNLWAFALVAIGIRVIGKVTMGTAVFATALVFAFTLALTLIPAALM